MQNRANNVSQKHNGGHDGLSGYIASSLKSVRHRYIIFVFMVCSVFTACSPGLVYLGPVAMPYTQAEVLTVLM